MDLKLWKDFPQLQNQLQQTENLMKNQIQIPQTKFKNDIYNLIQGKSKMLRGGLLLIFATHGPLANKNDTLQKNSASVEILHLASLIHDDVIDKAETRRGVATLNHQFGQKNAIYIGDFLFTKYFELLTSSASSLQHIQHNLARVEKILFGELDQNIATYDVNRSKKNYLKSINGKTAELFAMCAEEGAYISQYNAKEIDIAEKIGRNIGMAFQLQDDLIDFSPALNSGKPSFNDITKGIYTLPIIETLNSAYGSELKRIITSDSIKRSDLPRIKTLVEKADGIQKTKLQLNIYVNNIKKLISLLSNEQTKLNLEKFINKLFLLSLSKI